MSRKMCLLLLVLLSSAIVPAKAANIPFFALTSSQCDPLSCDSNTFVPVRGVATVITTINGTCQNGIEPGPEAFGAARVQYCSFDIGLDANAAPNRGSAQYYDDVFGLIVPDTVDGEGSIYAADFGFPLLIWDMQTQSDCFSNSIIESVPPDETC